MGYEDECLAARLWWDKLKWNEKVSIYMRLKDAVL